MPEKHFIEIEDAGFSSEKTASSRSTPSGVDCGDERVAAVHYEADSDKWIFFCHGFGGDKEGNTGGRAKMSPKYGFNGVAFDFRGNGESDGKFIEQTLSSRIEDLKTVINYFEPEKYVLFGSSFGGKVVFHAATELEPEAIIGKAPVTYNEIMDKFKAVVENKGKFEYIDGKPIDHRFIEDLEKHSFEQVTEELNIPAAIFHGADDTTVHPEHSFRAAQELNADVLLQKLEGQKHRFSDKAEQRMRQQMFDWLELVV